MLLCVLCYVRWLFVVSVLLFVSSCWCLCVSSVLCLCVWWCIVCAVCGSVYGVVSVYEWRRERTTAGAYDCVCVREKEQRSSERRKRVKTSSSIIIYLFINTILSTRLIRVHLIGNLSIVHTCHLFLSAICMKNLLMVLKLHKNWIHCRRFRHCDWRQILS